MNATTTHHSASAAKGVTMGPLFDRLSGELRNKIYRHVIEDEIVDIQATGCNVPDHPLSQVCKQARSEFKALHEKEVKFTATIVDFHLMGLLTKMRIHKTQSMHPLNITLIVNDDNQTGSGIAVVNWASSALNQINGATVFFQKFLVSYTVKIDSKEKDTMETLLGNIMLAGELHASRRRMTTNIFNAMNVMVAALKKKAIEEGLIEEKKDGDANVGTS